MLKNIILFIELILLTIVLSFISLLFGITLSNLSYENITISKLYLKYDKNLIVKIDNFIISDNNSSSTHRFNLNTHIDYIDNKYFIDIKQLKYYTHELTLKAKLKLNNNDIQNILNKEIDKLQLDDFSFRFDKIIKPVLTDKTFIRYKNDNIYFDLENPSVDNIKLPKSKVILKNVSKNMLLYLELKSNDKINTKLINIITYYGLKLPIKQFYGTNKIEVKVEVPFYNSDVKIYVNVKSKNTKIIYDEKIINAKDLSVVFKNNILYIKSNIGDININKKDIKFKEMNLIYKDNLFDIKAQNGQIHILDRNITFNDLVVDFNVKNNHLQLNSKSGKTLLSNNIINYKNLEFDSLNEDIKINIESGTSKVYENTTLII